METPKNAAYWFKVLLPSPFVIALFLTFLSIVFALLFGENPSSTNKLFFIAQAWEGELFKSSLILFTFQMLLILVLGHTLALSEPFNKAIQKLTQFGTSTANAAAITALSTMLVGYFNWGLALIFGAILARKMGEHALQKNTPINYPIVGAAGYTGLLVWHGGISGSSLIKVAENGHLQKLMEGTLSANQIELLPEFIGFNETVFSSLNIVSAVLNLGLITLLFYWLGKQSKPEIPNQFSSSIQFNEDNNELVGAEKIEHSAIFIKIVGALVLLVVGTKLYAAPQLSNFFTPNNINLLLLGLALFLHKSTAQFTQALNDAVGGAGGIIIQFPLYFGIMGILRETHLIQLASEVLVSISTPTLYPIFTLVSAGLVNLFVPSGGGQWLIQGPILIKAALELGVPLHKAILALAYGDQLTNMLQPFWALPLLSITQLKAQKILPYSALALLVSFLIAIFVLLVF